jgi:5-carboxymethyl-2-hydroxymuconate isomerase
MPHLVLDYSANVDCPADLPMPYGQLNAVLAETVGIRRDNCDSRVRQGTWRHNRQTRTYFRTTLPTMNLRKEPAVWSNRSR